MILLGLLGYAHLCREFPLLIFIMMMLGGFCSSFHLLLSGRGYCCSFIMKENSWFMSGFSLNFIIVRLGFIFVRGFIYQPEDIVVDTSWKKLFRFMLGFFSLELCYYPLGWFCSLLRLPLIGDISVVKSQRNYFLYFIMFFLLLYSAFLVFVDFCLNICRFLFSFVCIFVSIHSVTKKRLSCFSSNFSSWLLGCGLEALNLGLCLSKLPMNVFFPFVTMFYYIFGILWMHSLVPWHCFKFFMLYYLNF